MWGRNTRRRTTCLQDHHHQCWRRRRRRRRVCPSTSGRERPTAFVDRSEIWPIGGAWMVEIATTHRVHHLSGRSLGEWICSLFWYPSFWLQSILHEHSDRGSTHLLRCVELSLSIWFCKKFFFAQDACWRVSWSFGCCSFRDTQFVSMIGSCKAFKKLSPQQQIPPDKSEISKEGFKEAALDLKPLSHWERKL